MVSQLPRHKFTRCIMKTILVLELLLMTMGGGRGGGDEQPHTLCGRRLAVVRMFYCSNTKDAIHKRDPEVLAFSYSDTNALDQIWPWRHPQRALLLTSSSRAKRESGLADECCVKPCYSSEILNYC